MTDDKGYQGWTNYGTWCVHLWISNEEPAYRYWNDLAQKLLNEQEHATAHLRDALKAHFDDAMRRSPFGRQTFGERR